METNALDAIRHQINAGDRQQARIALVELLEIEPDNADAWALLAILLPQPAEQARCYREILRIRPGDRQAELWLEALAGTQSPALEPKEWSCPRCGGMVRASSQPGAPGGRRICPHCGFHVKPSDAFGDEVPSDLPSIPVEGELGPTLQEASLPGDEAQQSTREPAMQEHFKEPEGFLDGLLRRRRQGASEPEAENLVMGRGETPSAAGALSPDLILRLAGGPLAPHERRNCPQCDAVVSRRDARCPWCSAPLLDPEGEQ